MNRIFSKLFLAAAGVFFMSACDNISEADRYIEVDKVEAARVVLIEDFTGQNCVNCPDAHKVIELLQEQYPGSVVPVSIHAGGFGISKDKTDFEYDYIGLMTDDGNYYNDSWGISSWPAGVINRRGGATEYDKWASLVRDELARPTALTINLTAEVTDGKVKTEITLEPSENIAGALNVWVLESGIVARQKQSDGTTNRQYVHNHVYRASLTGLNGKTVDLRSGVHQTFDFETDVVYNEHERWNSDNLSIVAFVTDDSGVHQAAIVEVEAPAAE